MSYEKWGFFSGGCGFLGQHIVRELQRWNAKQIEHMKKKRTTSSSDKRGSHGNDKSDHVSVNISHDENSESVESDDCELLRMSEEIEFCNFGIKEIRILDIKPLTPVFELMDSPPIIVKHCDIRHESQMPIELVGVDVVFHCAAATIQNLNKPTDDKEERQTYWETNLEGTENVVWGCRKANVKALIYTSTVATVMGKQPIVSHTETLSPVIKESELILGDYARSKKRAEDVIIDAHRTTTDNEEELRTTVIRPVALYGEGDTKLIPTFIDMAKKAGGKLPTLGGPLSLHQLTYAGNAAYAHICAMVQLVRGSVHPLRDCGGLPTYVCDDSPTGSSDQVLSPFLQNFGLRASSPVVPLFFIIVLAFMMNIWVSFWERLGWSSSWSSSVPSMRLQTLAAAPTIVNRTRAELSLQYFPIYTWEEAKQASLAYYERYIESRAMMALEMPADRRGRS